MPQDYAFVMEELITEKPEILDKEAYYETIIDTIIQTDRAESFIVAMSELIQRLAVEHLHILGDIYDRGPAPHKIMDKLLQYHSLDIQWGNHDIVWMEQLRTACLYRNGYPQLCSILQSGHLRRWIWHQLVAAGNICDGSLSG